MLLPPLRHVWRAMRRTSAWWFITVLLLSVLPTGCVFVGMDGGWVATRVRPLPGFWPCSNFSVVESAAACSSPQGTTYSALRVALWTLSVEPVSDGRACHGGFGRSGRSLLVVVGAVGSVARRGAAFPPSLRG